MVKKKNQPEPCGYKWPPKQFGDAGSQWYCDCGTLIRKKPVVVGKKERKLKYGWWDRLFLLCPKFKYEYEDILEEKFCDDGPCPFCNGTGIKPVDREPCSRCEGKGWEKDGYSGFPFRPTPCFRCATMGLEPFFETPATKTS